MEGGLQNVKLENLTWNKSVAVEDFHNWLKTLKAKIEDNSTIKIGEVAEELGVSKRTVHEVYSVLHIKRTPITFWTT